MDLTAYTDLVHAHNKHYHFYKRHESLDSSAYGSYRSEKSATEDSQLLHNNSVLLNSVHSPGGSIGSDRESIKSPSQGSDSLLKHNRDESYDSLDPYRNYSDDSHSLEDNMPSRNDLKRHSTGSYLSQQADLRYSASLDTYYKDAPQSPPPAREEAPPRKYDSHYRSNPDISESRLSAPHQPGPHPRIDNSYESLHSRSSSSDSLDAHRLLGNHSRTSSGASTEFIPTRTTGKAGTSQPARNPLQFIKAPNATQLAETAKHQIQLVKETKKAKVIADEVLSSDWQSVNTLDLS